MRNNKVISDIETGEGLECVSFYIRNDKSSIACEGSFGDSEEHDFDGWLGDDGIIIEIKKETNSKEFVFGICWVSHLTDENDIQTWFGAEP